jgi:hypothetical protein
MNVEPLVKLPPRWRAEIGGGRTPLNAQAPMTFLDRAIAAPAAEPLPRVRPGL